MLSNQTFWKKVLKVYRQRRLYPAIYERVFSILRGIRYLTYNPASSSISLHYPEYAEPSKDELGIVKRIFCAFRKMKEDQKHVPDYYLPSSMWQTNLSEAYSSLVSGLEENDITKFHYFLANFGAWKKYHGIEHNILIKNCMKSFIKRRYLQNEIFYRQLKLWKWFYGDRKPISYLSYPPYGNQSGAYINNVFVGVGSFFNEIHGSLLSELISGIKRPVIADLGAGYGRLAFFILRAIKDFTFIDFDLPETLCLAAYYLMKVYPDKKSLLYGEENYSPAIHSKYDLIFMPSYEISRIGSSTVDLFINKNSLGEMTKNAANNYIHYITQATKYFFHMNHDITPNSYSNGDFGMLSHEYPIPSDQFTLLFRYPDIGQLLLQGWVDLREDIFMYLYERKTPYLLPFR